MSGPGCKYCKEPIEGGRLPYCSIVHFAWDKFGTPPLLAKKQLQNERDRKADQKNGIHGRLRYARRAEQTEAADKGFAPAADVGEVS